MTLRYRSIRKCSFLYLFFGWLGFHLIYTRKVSRGFLYMFFWLVECVLALSIYIALPKLTELMTYFPTFGRNFFIDAPNIIQAYDLGVLKHSGFFASNFIVFVAFTLIVFVHFLLWIFDAFCLYNQVEILNQKINKHRLLTYK